MQFFYKSKFLAHKGKISTKMFYNTHMELWNGKSDGSGCCKLRISMVSTFKLGSESIVLHLVLRYFQLQKPCQHLHWSNLVLYSSGFVTGKRSQKKHIEPARNATDATPVTEKTTKQHKKLNATLQTLTLFHFMKENRSIYIYTPFVRGDEKTGKPIILQKTWATIGDNRFPVVHFLNFSGYNHNMVQKHNYL